MNKTVLCSVAILCLSCAVFLMGFGMTVKASPGVIHVPDDYEKIQWAIGNATAGDTIFIKAGIYREHLVVSKAVSLVGEDTSTTIIDGRGEGTVVHVTASHVYISGFTIRDSGLYPRSGIYIEGGVSCTVTHNNLENTGYSVRLENCDSCKVTYNNLDGNYFSAILQLCNNSVIAGNNASNNAARGIALEYSVNCSVVDNTVDCNSDFGVSLDHCVGCSLSENSVNRNHGYGIELLYSSGCFLVRNNVAGCDGDGIRLGNCSSCVLSENNMTDSKRGSGLYVWLSRDCTVARNTVTNNSQMGISLGWSGNCRIAKNILSRNYVGVKLRSNDNIFHHNNFINNTHQVYTELSYNATWDDGYPSGGNYWSDYAGADLYSDPYQNVTGSDGMGDMPHIIEENNQDHYPLMAPIGIFDVGSWNGSPCETYVVSNSTISNFQLSETEKTISFNVAGLNYTLGFCRITIPNIIVQDWWHGDYIVLVNGQPVEFRNWTDGTHTCVYFTYLHSKHEVTIISEFPSLIILTLFMTATLLTVVVHGRKSHT